MEWTTPLWHSTALAPPRSPPRLAKLRKRLELSKAKHKSLAGHARMSRCLAGFVPFYEYDEDRFFSSDDAPADIVAPRRAGFAGLRPPSQRALPKPSRRTGEASAAISDLQFTARYRVPFQFSRIVRQHLPSASFVQSSAGVTVTDLDGNRFYDLTGSYGVNRARLRFLQRLHRARRERVRELGPGAGLLSSR